MHHGHQKQLDIAIVLTAKPCLLLLVEPLEGMNPGEVEEVLKIISKIKSDGTTILLIEHNMRAVMKICERIVLFDFGQKIVEGSPAQTRKDDKVIAAYLGAGKYGK